jgi:hypothetical protein
VGHREGRDDGGAPRAGHVLAGVGAGHLERLAALRARNRDEHAPLRELPGELATRTLSWYGTRAVPAIHQPGETMDETAANDQAPQPVDEWDVDEQGPRLPSPPGEIILNLDPESRAMLEDMSWENEQHNAGAWTEFQGEYIAVYHKRLYGHGPDPLALREQVARNHGLPAGKIVIQYIDHDFTC